jgi:hypothetical protein
MTPYFWYLNNTLLDATYQPYIDIYSSGCLSGTNKISVCTGISGDWTIFAKAEVMLQPDCISCSSYSSYSAAYPNPAGNELIIDRIEEGNSTETAINTKSAISKVPEIRVLLYSHSTAKIVYEKTYSSSEKQIRIDTSKLPNGVYYLNIISNGEKVKEQTIIVNH